MRELVIQRLAEFADPTRREEDWKLVDGEFSDAVEDFLHFAGEPDARSGVGVVFETLGEADAADAVLRLLDQVLREVGLPMTYERVSADTRWAELEEKAAAALAEMQR
jgi:hypothetical protein